MQKPAEPQQLVSTSSVDRNSLVTLDCGTSIDCFISASKSCSPAKTVYTATVDVFGVKQTSTLFLEIKGEESGRCIFIYVQKKLT